MEKTNKRFISDIDQQLAKFDRVYRRSDAQIAEIKKYKQIHQSRDTATAARDNAENIWD